MERLYRDSKKADSGELTSADAFGTRDRLKNNYMLRMAGAVLGIYGNTAEEAIYPLYFLDDAKKPLNAARQHYIIRFEPGKLPPVNAFWSLTMYDLPDRFLVASKSRGVTRAMEGTENSAFQYTLTFVLRHEPFHHQP